MNDAVPKVISPRPLREDFHFIPVFAMGLASGMSYGVALKWEITEHVNVIVYCKFMVLNA